MTVRPDAKNLIGKDTHEVPMSCQRIMKTSSIEEPIWIGPEEATSLSSNDKEAYELAHTILRHLAIQAPLQHKSGHPGGSLSAFTFCYFHGKRRGSSVDQPLRMSAGHLSVLAFGLQWLFGREENDPRLQSPQSIIDTFRTPDGLPGHAEAKVGDIPFGAGPLGKGVSNALGVAFGLKYLKKPGIVDVLLADGDSQEGQVMEAFRLAPHLEIDNLIVHGDFNDIQLSDMPTKTVAADFARIAAAAGWYVIEVQNGNDPTQVLAAQEKADSILGNKRPVFICYYTTMGYGISFMEEGSNTGEKNYHGAPLSEEEAEKATAELMPLDKAVDKYQKYHDQEKARYESKERTATDIEIAWKTPNGYTRTITEEKGAARKDFGAVHILNLMKADDRIVVLHADIAGSGGFNKVEKEFPNRCINVGVAEANMYMMAAGMRQTGLLPVTYTFAAFGTYEARANARLIDINCEHTRCGILNDCTHSGLSVGEDGETHQERNYLNIPLDNTMIWSCADCNQAAAMAEKAFETIAEGHKSVYTFFPRSSHEQLKSPDGKIIYGSDYAFDGKADLIRGANDVSDQATIISTGITIHAAVRAADTLKDGVDKIQARVLNVASIRPIDSSAIIQAALETGHLIVVEDHHSEGGLATQVADIIADFGLPCSLRRLGVNHYFPSGPSNDLMFLAGLDEESIANAVQDEVRTEVCGGEDTLVASVYELIHNIQNSRFGDAALSFVKKIKDEKGYLEALREYWSGRECPKDKLPSSDDLRTKMNQIQS